MTGKVVKLDPDLDPRINSLYDRLEKEIYDSIAGTDVTVVAVVGILELLKSNIIDNHLK